MKDRLIKAAKITGIFFLVIGSIWFCLFLFPLTSESEQAYLEGDEETLVIAHRGGLAHAPEGTLEAFRYSDELGVDILEYDVHITSDNHLVVIHDSSVDRTTDGSGLVNELTLEEIQTLDAGYRFQDENGAYV